jgi:DNA-binding NtrC family response regulator
MKTSHVLVLDRDPARRDNLVRALKAEGLVPVVADGPLEAARALGVPGLDLALIELGLPDLVLTSLQAALAPSQPTEPEPLDAVERHHIARALQYTGGNKRRTAHLLGIARSTLLAKVRKYGLEAAVGTEPNS